MEINLFSKILVAIDGSKFSEKGIEYAKILSKKFNSELTLLTVLDFSFKNIPSTIITAPTYGIEKFNKMRDSIEKYHKIALSELEKEKIIAKSIILEDHSAVKTILNLSEREKIDLIIINTRGNTGLKKMLLGSVATGVVTYSHCPVMVIR